MLFQSLRFVRPLILITVSCLLPVLSGCKNRPGLSKTEIVAELNKEKEEAEPEQEFEMSENYTPPPGIQFQPKRSRSASFKSFDMQGVLKNERPVKLSDFGKELKYHRIKGKYYGFKEIIAIPDGYLLLPTSGGVTLLDKEFQPVRVLIKEDIQVTTNGDMIMVSLINYISSMVYDSKSGIIKLAIQKNNKDTSIALIGTISLKELLALSQPMEIDDFKNLTKVNRTGIMKPLKEGYATLGRLDTSIYTFNIKGDTLCHFEPTKKLDPNLFSGKTTRGAESTTYYMYNGEAYYRPAYTNIIFHIKDPSTFEEVYQINFGDKQVSPEEGPSVNISLANKLMLDSWVETDKYIFMRFTQDYDCPNTRKSGSVKFHQAFYNKNNKEFYSFTDRNNISQPYSLGNDIDEGPDFWPTGVIDGKLYMRFSGKNLKKFFEGKTIPEELSDLIDEEIILITLN